MPGSSLCNKGNVIAFYFFKYVVQTLDSAIQRINHYPVDSLVGFPTTYAMVPAACVEREEGRTEKN